MAYETEGDVNLRINCRTAASRSPVDQVGGAGLQVVKEREPSFLRYEVHDRRLFYD